MSREITTPLNAIVEYSHLIVDCADNAKKNTSYAMPIL